MTPEQKRLSLRQLFASCHLLLRPEPNAREALSDDRGGGGGNGRTASDGSSSSSSSSSGSNRSRRPESAPDRHDGGGSKPGSPGTVAASSSGTLVVRMGDMLTRWSVGLLYIVFRSFDAVRIVRPFTTSPLDPERWVVCTGFRGLSRTLAAHMLAAEQRSAAGENVLAMVPMQLLLEPGFMTFVTRANDRFATREITAIKAVQAVKGAGAPATADDKEFAELGTVALAKLGL